MREHAVEVYARSIRAYERDKSLIPEGQLHEIRYEELATDPVGQLRTAYEGVGLGGFDALEATLAPQVPKLTSYKRNKFRMDEETQNFVYDKAKFVFDLYDYDRKKEAPQTA